MKESNKKIFKFRLKEFSIVYFALTLLVALAAWVGQGFGIVGFVFFIYCLIIIVFFVMV